MARKVTANLVPDDETLIDHIMPYIEAIVEKIKGIDRSKLVIYVGLATASAIGTICLSYYVYNSLQEALSSTEINIDENCNIINSREVLILHQCPRAKLTPCIAPYPLKLETFLRIHNIKYRVEHFGTNPRPANTPWITLNLQDICEPEDCVKFISEQYNVSDELVLDETAKSVSRAYSHLLDNHLYWGIALWRWVYDEARSVEHIQHLPPATVQMLPEIRKTVEQAAWFHGIGKKKPQDVVSAVETDLKALSEFLGDKTYFMGGKNPTELDCTAFAMLSQMLWTMKGSPFEKLINEKLGNLIHFTWRMREKFWPDWEDCLDKTGVVVEDRSPRIPSRMVITE